MLFHQSLCKKSQKGVYLYYQTLQNGADDIIMKRKNNQLLLDWKEKRK